MRIAFFMRNVGYIRNFEWVIRELARRGYDVQIVVQSAKMQRNEQAAHAHLKVLCEDCRNVSYQTLLLEDDRSRFLTLLTRFLRLAQDYLRYLEPEFAATPKLTRRAAERLKVPALRASIDFIGQTKLGRRYLRQFLSRFDRAIPPPAKLIAFLQKTLPDVVIATPVFGHGSSEPDCFKAAKQLGLRTCLPVASWDNLTSKGLAHAEPDRVLVWNDAQKSEAIQLHGIPPHRICVTGAHSYDHWFRWRPSGTRDAFLQKVGLAAGQPYILYLGSSPFIAPNEPPTVLKWLAAIRESGISELEKVGVLIRPHPQNADSWAAHDISAYGNTTIYPRGGSNPVNSQAKSDYYDSLYHCRLVVGVNTSGMIEAGILGKAVHTVLFEETAETQEGTLHFQHLAAVDNGLLFISPDLPHHIQELAKVLSTEPNAEDRSKHFVERFIRPAYLDKLPTETFVDVVEDLGRQPSPKRRPTTASKLRRWYLPSNG